MGKENRKRGIRISVHLSEEEHQLLKERMAMIGVTNQEAFIRKMILDGLIVRLELSELKEMISLLRYSGNNINQIANHLNATGRIYEEDIAEIKENQTRLWDMANQILLKLSKI